MREQWNINRENIHEIHQKYLLTSTSAISGIEYSPVFYYKATI